ncbi:phospholipase D family protein [Glaciimonas sp. CA11.2]|uniref:phospholipase D family nuclease n=1 Tax=unclassified Glaciimonas TaxID=2644401 RepID=UPI002AB45219|nr:MULTISPECIES: phospholipase D family protein [unclassified Glaciimonas]MDY7547544.1 phospholipase D family protein [Glaciimonas sp. CA11.2]MEB0013512.1 phospholipase D family protein [Glaciimonas sp. Cout2]MEB0081591.1 phospholipase D family protein [Glaciimonas sp. Gout2]MEB0163534.1 phospholipase D family protein [Glaciimonas sp. CA11.2]
MTPGSFCFVKLRERLVAATIIITMGLAAAQVRAFDATPPRELATGTLQAAFSPWDDIEGLITQEIAGARKQVLVQAYILTNRPIATALIAARKRGVDVQILVDEHQLKKNPGTQVERLVTANIPVWGETNYRSAHNKVIVIDPTEKDATVITGSFNFTWSAQHKNAENVLIVRDNPAIAARYAMNWQRHLKDARSLPDTAKRRGKAGTKTVRDNTTVQR